MINDSQPPSYRIRLDWSWCHRWLLGETENDDYCESQAFHGVTVEAYT